jgi:hypothetical protein
MINFDKNAKKQVETVRFLRLRGVDGAHLARRTGPLLHCVLHPGGEGMEKPAKSSVFGDTLWCCKHACSCEKT